MELRIVNPDPRYAPPPLTDPPSAGYLHIAASVAPPVGPPFVRPNAGRTRLLDQLKRLAGELDDVAGVVRVSVYRGILIPPLGPGAEHPARFDVAVLVETSSLTALETVADSAPYQQMLATTRAAARSVHVMAARCVRSLGEVDKTRPGLFLFNHFAAEDPAVALRLWEHLAGWYVAETGLDNSTLLAPNETADYALVNHARWDKSPARLAVEQFAKPSFSRYVRANLRAHRVVAMPVLYRLA